MRRTQMERARRRSSRGREEGREKGTLATPASIVGLSAYCPLTALILPGRSDVRPRWARAFLYHRTPARRPSRSGASIPPSSSRAPTTARRRSPLLPLSQLPKHRQTTNDNHVLPLRSAVQFPTSDNACPHGHGAVRCGIPPCGPCGLALSFFLSLSCPSLPPPPLQDAQMRRRRSEALIRLAGHDVPWKPPPSSPLLGDPASAFHPFPALSACPLRAAGSRHAFPTESGVEH